MGDGRLMPFASRAFMMGLGNFMALNEVTGGGGESPSTRIEFCRRVR
jgi:hypothetical protein